MRWSTSITMMFREHPFLDRFAAARDAGFAGVEIQVMEDSPTRAAQAARAAGVAVALLNCDMGDFLAGGPGLSGAPGREKAFGAALAAGLEAAGEMEAHGLHIGPSRIPVGTSREACLASLHANLDHALEQAEAVNIPLLIEPMNRADMPDALVATLDEASEVIAACEHRIGLQFDAYHVARGGEDPTAAYLRWRAQVAHIQISDAPGRVPPGNGTIDFDPFFKALRDTGYAGWIGAEYFAQGPTRDTLDWLNRHA